MNDLNDTTNVQILEVPEDATRSAWEFFISMSGINQLYINIHWIVVDADFRERYTKRMLQAHLTQSSDLRQS